MSRRVSNKVTVTYADGTTRQLPAAFFNRRLAGKRRSRRFRIKGKSEWQRQWYLRTDHWLQVRMQAKVRDGYCCTRCGNSDRVLHVHHLTYDRKGVEWLEDVATLCDPCHKRTHGIR